MSIMQALTGFKRLRPTEWMQLLRSTEAYGAQQTCGYAKKINTTKNAEKQAAGKPVQTDSDPRLKILLDQLKPVKVEPDNFTAEELAAHERRAKEFSKNKMAAHRLLQSRLSRKARIKKAAYDALPAELKKGADKDDFTLMPPDRLIPMETPPIKTYREWKARQQQGGQKQ